MAVALSIWEREAWYQPADVVIAGAGLVGLWTAYEIKKRQPTKTVLVLEQGSIPQGASTRNAGFACFGSPSEMWHDASVIGKTAMLDLVEMRYRGIQKIMEVLPANAIGFDACGGYECYTESNPNIAAQIAELNSWLAPIMHTANAFEIATPKMGALGLSGFADMVHNRLEGGLHSGRLVSALSQLVQEMGVQILYGTKVATWHSDAHKVTIGCSNKTIEAGALVLATNAYLSEMLPALGVQPARGQVLVTQPIEGLPMKGTFHFDEGFYYWRNIGNRILLGGARNADMQNEATLAMETSATIQQQLERFLITHLPQYFNSSNLEAIIALRWSGLMAMSETKQPVLKQVEPGIWAAMSCNGMGVALSPVFAAQVAGEVLTSR